MSPPLTQTTNTMTTPPPSSSPSSGLMADLASQVLVQLERLQVEDDAMRPLVIRGVTSRNILHTPTLCVTLRIKHRFDGRVYVVELNAEGERYVFARLATALKLFFEKWREIRDFSHLTSSLQVYDMHKDKIITSTSYVDLKASFDSEMFSLPKPNSSIGRVMSAALEIVEEASSETTD
ncbi:hypothetical protein RI054_23g98970 [Pseudoscourfieldia marina]